MTSQGLPLSAFPPMRPHRRILSSETSNGWDCFFDCPEECYYGGCSGGRTPSPPLSPTHDLFIAAGCLIAAVICLALTCYVVCSHQSRHRRRLTRSNEGGRRMGIIKTVGLDEATIATIPVHEYKRAAEGLLGTDCSVCLSDFEEGELVRLLPNCSHAFHVACIDVWIRAHINCPLCRALIFVASPPDPPPLIDERPSERLGVVIIHFSSDPREGGSTQMLRRSASMSKLPLGVEQGEGSGEANLVEQQSSNKRGKQQDVCKEEATSGSGSEGMFFFHKYRRSKSLILPF